MEALLAGIDRQLALNGPWMTGNLLLALSPWALAVWLFRREQRPGAGWWLAAAACILLLPNAAYVLTDVIHLPRTIRREPSDAVVLLGVLPMFAALFTLGFAAYVDSLRRMSAWATARGWVRRGWTVELAVHAVSAVAIYAGRIHRFNSWDVARQPETVLERVLDGFTRPAPVIGMAIMFVVLTVGYFGTRPLLQLAERRGR